MGVKGLGKILNKHEHDVPNSGITRHPNIKSFIDAEKRRLITEEINKYMPINPIKQMEIKKRITDKPYIIAIDAILCATRFKKNFKSIACGFIKQIILSLTHQIIPVYVFDGSIPECKKETVALRRNIKNNKRKKIEDIIQTTEITNMSDVQHLSSKKIMEHLMEIYKTLDYPINEFQKKTDNVWDDFLDPNFLFLRKFSVHKVEMTDVEKEAYEIISKLKKNITVEYNEIENIKLFFSIIGVPFIVADEEADSMLALLNKENLVHACQSDDMDLLVRGCQNLIKIAPDGSVTQYNLENILKSMNLTYLQFVDLCAILGSDYYINKIKTIDSLSIFELFCSTKNKNIDDFVECYKQHNDKVLNCIDGYKMSRDEYIKNEETVENFKIKLSNFCMIPEFIDNYFKENNIDIDIVHNSKIINMMDCVNKFVRSLI